MTLYDGKRKRTKFKMRLGTPSSFVLFCFVLSLLEIAEKARGKLPLRKSRISFKK